MIVDHLVTRTGVRSLGLLITGIVPLASSYFCYMLAYRESPVDTLLSQLPLVLQLFQANASTLLLQGSFSEGTASHGRFMLENISIPGESSLDSSPSIHSSSHATLAYAAAATAVPSSPTLATRPDAVMSPLIRGAIVLVQYLESKGLNHPQAIPGYRHFVALQPLKERWLDPALAFLSLHQTLAIILTGLHLWMAAELVFYILFWKRLAHLQEVDRVVKGVGAKAKRQELFQRCLETVEEGDGVKRWIEVWFDTGRTNQPAQFEDIGRENMLRWMAWAFWAAPYQEVFQSPSAVQELNQMVDTIESVKKVKFSKGFNPDVDCIRMCLDPVIASHRPLIYYALLWVANVTVGLLFNLIGLTRYNTTLDKSHAFESSDPSKVHTKVAGETRATPDLAYWYRSPVNPENDVPLVFIHGIGIGLVQYVHLVIALTFISRPLILIEVPYVSSQLFSAGCMTPNESYIAVERILKRHGHPKASFYGHSLGTMLCAAICRASSATSPKSIVAGLVLVDPICFLTHHSLARNFAYRAPATACQLVIDLFAAREIGTSWYIMRRFTWTESIFFPIAWARRDQKLLPHQGKLSPVLPERTRVFLSSKDNLLDMEKVAHYLRTQVGLVEGGGEDDELVVMEGMDHAQFLLRPEWFNRVLKAAREC
ncbi:hypothetical protein BGZ67_010107 [Mortierella alpina]|nr:hypothetical protein BGZ67_010107 [Mortierella alpina]